MPSQGVLIGAICLVLLVALAARIALNGQITLARLQAREAEQRWREGHEGGGDDGAEGTPPER